MPLFVFGGLGIQKSIKCIKKKVVNSFEEEKSRRYLDTRYKPPEKTAVSLCLFFLFCVCTCLTKQKGRQKKKDAPRKKKRSNRVVTVYSPTSPSVFLQYESITALEL